MLSPRLVYELPFLKCIFSTFHDIDNLLMSITKVNIALRYINPCVLIINNKYSFRISENWYVCLYYTFDPTFSRFHLSLINSVSSLFIQLFGYSLIFENLDLKA